ncbi:MAG: NAD(P)/FAD-dependent oxidoreductase [Hyphomicrobiaceae bacterium]
MAPEQAARHGPRAIVIGAGPAGLSAAETLAHAGCVVTVYERMARPARKFLLAGRGGLNLTNTRPLADFLKSYEGSAAPRVRNLVDAFPPEALRAWCHGLGIDTFVGTSGRVFPTMLKASPLLRAWLRRLEDRGVTLATGHRWLGFESGLRPTFETSAGLRSAEADVVVLALGGASWPRLGADGAWLDHLRHSGIDVVPFEPSNCGVHVNWTPYLRARFAGSVLKRVIVGCGARTAPGDLVVTETGLEGGAIYAVVPAVRDALGVTEPRQSGHADIVIDLRPDLTLDQLRMRLAERHSAKQSTSTWLRKAAGLAPPAIALLREPAAGDANPVSTTPATLSMRIKALRLRVVGLASLDRAISSAGGIAAHAVDEHLMLKARPGVFVAGEILDWDAPTGGYLLQATFATGRAAALGAVAWLDRARAR